MANTYTQIHIQAVFAVQNRRCLIDKMWEDELYKYITGIIQNYDHKVLQINGMPDHIHILFNAKPQTDLIKFINNWKSATSKVLRNKFPQIKTKLWKDVFWSKSYCLITVGQVTLDQVKKYVENQGVRG